MLDLSSNSVLLVKNDVAREIYRKIVHIILSIFILLPFIIEIPIPTSSYYGLGLFLAAILNSFAVKGIQVKEDIQSLKEIMKSIFSSLEHELGEPVKIFEESIEKIEKFVLTQIEFLERDYERKEGYVGLLYGMIGVSVSSLLFPGHVIYGVFALMIVDPLSGLIGLVIGKKRTPPFHGTIEGSIVSFIAYTLFLNTFLGIDLLRASFIALSACLAEILSIEDNLTIPFVASLVAYLLQLREIYRLI